MRSAQEAFGGWSRRAITDRGAILHAGAEALLEHVDELAPGLVAEQGKTLREAKLELRKAADTLEHYAGLAKQVRGIAVHGLDLGVEGRVLRRPLGVVAAIVPWNFPTTLLSNKLGPALLCGNTVVAKPADTTPFTTLRLAEILTEAGLPPGVLNVVPGHRPGAGEALVAHPLVRKVAFTGSTPTGQRVAALAAQGTKRVTLELGGSDPMIICDDADLAKAASAASMGRFYNCGQACLAIKRVYVFDARGRRGRSPRSRTRRAGCASASAPARASTSGRCTPSASARCSRTSSRARWRTAARSSPAAGARPIPSSPAAGSTSPPSSSTRRTTRRWRPRRSSARCCPSGACATSTRRWRAPTPRRSASGRRCGRATSIAPSARRPSSSAATRGSTRPTKVYDELPFGGVKASGYGKEHGSEALDHYSDLKAVVVRRGEG